ncbi:MAG: alanine--tRNA ligase, partial [Christensenellaceae bacterium]|nr:alanine--tRNA ligase [Christensenellaceae bacterium]
IERKAEFLKKQGSTEVVEKIITGKAAFRLYDTFGFPIEVTEEIARERGYTVDRLGYEEEYKAHQDLSRTANEGQFKGGLSSYGKTETNYHTATHLLHAALSKTLNSECKQSGSNITPERMRFDFTFDRKLTSEEVKTVEDLVNAQIAAAIPVILSETSVKDAKDSGAIGVFDSKYGDVVKVYTIGGFSKEICGGPHAANTADLGHFRILKEEASSAGVRRIKAVLE